MWPVPCRQVCCLRVAFLRLDHVLEVIDLPQIFLHSKTPQSKVWEKILLLRSLLNYFSLKRNFEADFSVKIEVNKWMKTCKHGSCKLPPANPTYWQMGNLKPRTRQPWCAVCGKMAKPWTWSLKYILNILELTMNAETCLSSNHLISVVVNCK